jgi:hypothetical protein
MQVCSAATESPAPSRQQACEGAVGPTPHTNREVYLDISATADGTRMLFLSSTWDACAAVCAKSLLPLMVPLIMISLPVSCLF